MFLCKPCADEKDLGLFLFDIPIETSYGRCEACKNHRTTVDFYFPDEPTKIDNIIEKQERIEKALDYAIRYGGIDGDHHKAWVIDQIIRSLTGCPEIEPPGTDRFGTPHSKYGEQGKSEEYTTLIKKSCDGVDGPNTYTHATGIAP